MNDLKKMKRILLSTNYTNFHEPNPGSAGSSASGVIARPALTKYRKHPCLRFFSQAGSLPDGGGATGDQGLMYFQNEVLGNIEVVFCA